MRPPRLEPGRSLADTPRSSVTHLHGFNAELERTIPAERLIELHAMSGRDAIFIAPQGPEDAASGDFGKLEEEGGHERLVRDVISALYRDGLLEKPAYGLQVLTSHSGGYAATASLLDRGGLPIAAVFLYDSVYGYISTFEDHAAGGGVLFSNYTAYGGTDSNNLALAAALEDRGVTVSRDARMDHLLGGPAAIVFTESPHDNVMFEGLTRAAVGDLGWDERRRVELRRGLRGGLPHVLSGAETVWSYTTGGGAAVGRADRQVLVVGFGLETMADAELQPALAELAGWLSGG